MVETIWCNTCRKYLNRIVADSTIKGLAVKEVQKYAEGTDSITKFTAKRHLQSLVSILKPELIYFIVTVSF